MKNISLTLVIIFFAITQMFAQQNVVYHPSVISKAVYFDVSPPLRDMVAKAPAKADNSWKQGVVLNQPNPFKNKAINPPGPDPVRQTKFGSIQTDTTLENFEGNINTQGVLPPDTYGEAGPSYYFQVVNLHYSVFTKTGTKVLTGNNSSIFQGLPNNSNDGDGTLNYDEVNDRWVFSQFSLPTFPTGPFFQMVAVSQTNDPTGSWYRYEFQFASMPDYPKLAIWPDGIYMSANRFSSGSTTYQGTQAVAFEYPKMLTGDPDAQMVLFTLGASNPAYCFLPTDCDGPYPPLGTPDYFLYLNDQPDQIVVYEFHTDWTNTANSTFTQVSTLPVASFNGSLQGITQKGSSVKLDDLSGRLMYRLQFRKFTDHWSMVANASVNVGSGQAGVRWFELRSTGTTWSVYQQGTYAPDSANRWMGSIAMDEFGDIALGYSVASSSIFPSVRYTGRLDGDPLGEMTIAERGIINGGGAQTSNSQRWGDYSGMSVDPADPGTFWFTEEYIQNTTNSGWKTRVASFNFLNLFTVHSTANPPSICIGDSSELHAGASGGSGVYTYLWSSIPPGFSSTESDPVVTPFVTTQYICAVNDGTSTKTDTTKVTVHAEPTAFSGNDTSFALTVTVFPAQGIATDYSSLKWTTHGDGTFSSDTSANALYTTGWQDRQAGYFTLTLTAYPIPTCSQPASDDITVNFSPALGISGATEPSFNIAIYPNPAKNYCTVSITGLESGNAVVTLTDMTGRQVYSTTIAGPQKAFVKDIDLTNTARGIYFLKVQTSGGTKTEKVVVQ